MPATCVGIIGGTGLGEHLLAETGGETVTVETPFGPPSSDPLLANWEGVDVAFLSRHGPGHRFGPSQVPYRANIWALKKLGVSAIMASGATGSLRDEIEPGHLVICDQVIDKTFRRAGTFFDQGPVTHVELTEPFCPRLRAILLEASKHLNTCVHDRGTYVCMEGPQFSTRAESQMHRTWGGDLIGMTCMPEAKLAREAEICYAMIALPTDYDSWRLHGPERAGDDLLREIMGNLHRATESAISLIRVAIKSMSEDLQSQDGRGEDRKSKDRQCEDRQSCDCGRALELAIWSDKSCIDVATRTRLDLLIGRYFKDEES